MENVNFSRIFFFFAYGRHMGYCLPHQTSFASPFEPPHVKTNKMTCAPSEDSDQPGHQSLRCSHEETLDPQLHNQRTAKTNQTGRMSRLICLHRAHISFCWFCNEAAHLLCCCVSSYRSSQLHQPIMFPLFPENRKSIP